MPSPKTIIETPRPLNIYSVIISRHDMFHDVLGTNTEQND